MAARGEIAERVLGVAAQRPPEVRVAAPGPPAAGLWRQRTWDELLARIEDGKVIPIVGPELVLEQRAGAAMPLESTDGYEHIISGG